VRLSGLAEEFGFRSIGDIPVNVPQRTPSAQLGGVLAAIAQATGKTFDFLSASPPIAWPDFGNIQSAGEFIAGAGGPAEWRALLEAYDEFAAGSALPAFAHGGVVPGAMGEPQLAVVHGGEEVVPADERGGMRFVPPTTIYVQIDKRTVGRATIDWMRSQRNAGAKLIPDDVIYRGDRS
jgi:hypothetical protein